MQRIALLLLLLSALAGSAALAQTPASDSSVTRRKPARRQPVTRELERSAFADPRARELLVRARAARSAQDSALGSYAARTYQRLSVALRVRLGPEKILLRTENVGRVTWSRGTGAWIEPTGRRAVAPLFGSEGVTMDLSGIAPVPYFPGRETLWLPSSDMGVAAVEVDENQMLHPLATGAEAYYRYASGDSLTIRLPREGRVLLRELRITARRPQWRAFVGSFWFDAERGNLVRAAYRMAAELDIWTVIGEDERREIEREVDRAAEEGSPLSLARGLLNPLRANITAVTVEYGLYEGRFWLPRLSVAEGEAQAGFLRVPVRFEESFSYTSVNGDVHVPPIPSPAEVGLAAGDSTLGGHLTLGTGGSRAPADSSAAMRLAHDDSVARRHTARADSLRAAADSARAIGDTAEARKLTRRAERSESRARRVLARITACAVDSTHVSRVGSRYGGAVRVAVRMPCDTSRLSNSPDLAGSIYAPAEQSFGTAERDELLKSLDLSLQPGWQPQKPTFHTGLDLLRYNRVEGLSPGASATAVLGRGYTARAVARIGTGDWLPGGEISLTRSNGRIALGLGLFHRLAVANDDWGAPLSFGASVANALYARDEGFYYRAWGAELTGTRGASGPLAGLTLLWRAFAERQRSAGSEPNVQASLAGAFGGTSFGRNIEAEQLTVTGLSGELARSLGADPTRLRLSTRARAEGAVTSAPRSAGPPMYARVMLESTISRALGRFAAAFTAAAGTSAGNLPAQRAFYVGGLHSVRGQFARPDTAADGGRVGNSFWLARSELGLGAMAARPVVFYDIGWAGERGYFARVGRPLSGAGAGVSLLDGLLRLDVSRGIQPERRWRADLYLGSRF